MAFCTRLQAALSMLSAACVTVCMAHGAASAPAEPPHSAALDDAIVAAAKEHGVPERLIRRVIMRESKYDAKARNHSYWGLMQISYPTAKSMGFRGTPNQLLDPFVNLKYAVPYLANAFKIAGKSDDAAVRLYAAGYYFTARSKGLLNALRTADSAPLVVPPEQPVLASNAVVQPPQSIGIFGALFGPGRETRPPVQTADASPQPVQGQVSAASAQAQAPANAAAPSGTFDGPVVVMVADKNGAMSPPKKWSRDGGLTTIARGEQGLEQVASRGTDPSRVSHRRSKKITAFAALDLPSSSAQAYAAQGGADSRFAGAPSQTAIAQATGGPAQPAVAVRTPVSQMTEGQVDASREPIPGRQVGVASTPDTSAADEKPKKHKRRVARHRKDKSSEAKTQQAMAERPAEAAAQ